MPQLTIGDKSVTVGDEFLHLSPADQNATVAHIAEQIGAGAAAEAPPAAPVSVNDVARSAATGVPIVGGVLNKMDAATNAALAPLLNRFFAPENQLPEANFSERMAHSLRDQEGGDKKFAAEHPYVDTGAKLAGGVASMVPVMAAAPAAFGLAGETLAARAGMGALSGGAVGGADAATRGENVVNGAALGAGLGGALPVVARGIGAAVSAAKPTVPEIAGTASPKVLRALRDDGLNANTVESKLAELGPDATLADLGPNLRTQAEAIAAAPGPGQKVVLDAMTARASGAGGRIESALDQHLGPSVNPTELADQIVSRRKAAAAPLYADAYQTPITTTPEINSVLETPFGKLALQKAQTLAKNDINTPLGMFEPRPNGTNMTAAQYQEFLKSGQGAGRTIDVRGMDLVKRSLDDMHEQAVRAGANNRARVIDGLRVKLVGAVDAQAPKFAQARDVFSTESGIKDALENGRNLFSRSMSPDELGVTLKNMSGAERDAFTHGARSSVADIMGSARNDAGAARALFDKGWTREKLNAVLGQPATDALFSELEREGVYHATAAGIIGNSRTAARLAAGREFPNSISDPSLPHGTTSIDAALYVPRKAARLLAGSAMRAKAAKTGEDAAKALTATGASRTEIVQKLLREQADKATTEARRAQIERVLIATTRSAAPNVRR